MAKSKATRSVQIPKYTTRSARDDDRPEEVICCEELPSDLDLVYQQYGARYGLHSSKITEQLAQGNTPIVVLNDVRTIYEVKRLYGGIVKSIFVYRKAPRLDDFVNVAKVRSGPIDEQDIETRLKKAEAIYRIYIENIFLFDHVIINSQGRRELKMQVARILSGSAGVPRIREKLE